MPTNDQILGSKRQPIETTSRAQISLASSAPAGTLPLHRSRPFKNCILHIGTEKTGTSAVQNFCALNRKALMKDDGVYYSTLGGLGSQWELAAAAHDVPWTNPDLSRVFNISNVEDQANYRARLKQRLNEEFTKKGASCDTLFVSSEHFHSRLNTVESISFLRDFLSQWAEEIKVLVYFRRQDRVAVSLQSTKIKSASKDADMTFPPGTGQSLRYYNYDALYERWASVLGAENIIARIYQEASASTDGTVGDVLALLNIDPEKKKKPSRRINASLSRPAFYFLQELNKQLPKIVDGKLDPLAGQIINDVSELFPGKHHLAARTDAQEFVERFSECNERLRQLAFPERDEPLFDSDYSEYPESLDAVGLTTEEAVAIAIELSRRARERHLHDRSPIALLRKLARLS